MAEVVLGIGVSHSPQMTVPWANWELLRKKDENDERLGYPDLLKKADPELVAQVTPDVWKERYSATQDGIKKLGKMLQKGDLDAIVIFGDDQHEQFNDENMPAMAIFHGETFNLKRRRDTATLAPWWAIEEANWEDTRDEYNAQPELAKHLITSLTDQEFEITRCSQLRPEIGIGHAFSFLYRRMWPECDVPIVPVMVNTYYPPNQPTPQRCYALGQAVREAVAGWKGGKRVAVMASGGLSHIIMDESLDRAFIDGMLKKDREQICAVPRPKLRGGTSEILNWIAVAGASEHLNPTLISYQPGYRSPAATGCGMGCAYWN
jgi:hypothetical protein